MIDYSFDICYNNGSKNMCCGIGFSPKTSLTAIKAAEMSLRLIYILVDREEIL
jgi:hypothetical protein